MTYSLREYSAMIADSARADAYVAAMERVVRPGMTVLDLGAGSGFFSFEACRLGARRVYAIDPNPALLAARETAAANALGDRIVFLPVVSTEVELPERVDVVVSDMRGVLPLHTQHLPTLIDARTRFLATSGVLLPWRDTLVLSVFEAPDVHRRQLQPWGGRESPYSAEPIVRLLANDWASATLPVEAQLTRPASWATIDYHTTTSPNVAGRVRCNVTRAGVGHGVGMWFEAEVMSGIRFSSGPAVPCSIYGTGFFPWPEAVPLAEGDVVDVAVRADLVGREYVWRWVTRIEDGAGPARVKARFDQSTFFGKPAAVDMLHRQAPDHRPQVTDALAVDRFVLGLFGDDLTLAEIADAASARFPEQFGPGRDAFARVAALSARYRT